MPLAEPVPDLRSLELLRTVAERGSIRQAALVHNISQPAPSMRLHSLERVLGLELLDRSRGRAQLTPTGLAVIGWSEDVLDAMRTFLLSAAAVRSEGDPPPSGCQHDGGGVFGSRLARPPSGI